MRLCIYQRTPTRPERVGEKSSLARLAIVGKPTAPRAIARNLI
jgi:hypothetical protein